MNTRSKNGLVEQFIDQFEILRANTSETLQQVYRIRGDVYCRELNFEPEERCPGGLEQDAYDADAVHCLIRHRASQRPAGCIRVVLAAKSGPEQPLPLQSYYDDDALTSPFDPALLPRDSITEISRLAVHKDFRKSKVNCTVEPNSGASTEQNERCHGLLSTALFVAAVVLAEQAGRRHNFAMREPRLAALLRQAAGLKFKQVGDLIDHRGMRAPFHASTESLLGQLRSGLEELHNFVDACLTDDLALTAAA